MRSGKDEVVKVLRARRAHITVVGRLVQLASGEGSTEIDIILVDKLWVVVDGW